VLQKLNKKVRASALTITIIVSTILLILISALVLSAYYFRSEITAFKIDLKVNANMESGINYVLGSNLTPSSRAIESLQLGSDEDSVNILTDLWGFFGVASIHSYYRSFKKNKVFLYGSVLDENMNSSIYLVDHDRPLSLVGNTNLVGNVYLPKAGIKVGYINQRGFAYPKLVEGLTKVSLQQLPQLKQNIYTHISGLFDTSKSETIPGLTDSISQSFTAPPLVFEQTENIRLKNVNIDGHVVISSDSSITVSSDANLKNIILIAPVIRFENGFHGTIQAFASDSLIIEDNCHFQYPSAICLLKKNAESLPPVIVCKNSTIDGFVFSLVRETDKFKTVVNLTNTVVNGIVYCQGYLTLDGKIAGSVLTDYFIYRSGSAIYENHLVDVEIDRNKLSNFFVGSIFFNTDKSYKIVQWLQ
jgi:hypothetical protein